MFSDFITSLQDYYKKAEKGDGPAYKIPQTYKGEDLKTQAEKELKSSGHSSATTIRAYDFFHAVDRDNDIMSRKATDYYTDEKDYNDYYSAKVKQTNKDFTALTSGK